MLIIKVEIIDLTYGIVGTFDPIRTPSIVKHFLDNSNKTEPSVPTTSTTPVSPSNAVLVLSTHRDSNTPMVINFEGEF